MLDEHVELLERVAVHQQFHALARGELAALVLRVDAGLAAAQSRAGAPRLKLVDDVLHGPSMLQQMIKMLTVGALGNDSAPPGMAVFAAASSAASETSKPRMSSSAPCGRLWTATLSFMWQTRCLIGPAGGSVCRIY